MKKNVALVLGAGGFIGSHLVKRLKEEGFWVRGVDLKFPEFEATFADDFVLGDLRDQSIVSRVVDRQFDEVYQLAADMGGAGYIFTGENDADVMHNSALINLNVLESCRKRKKNIFYSSSACIYPEHNQPIQTRLSVLRNPLIPPTQIVNTAGEAILGAALFRIQQKS